MAVCEATGKKGNEDKCLNCWGRYLTAPSSPSSYVLTQPLQPQERKRGGAATALRQLALQKSRLLPELFNLGVMLIPYM